MLDRNQLYILLKTIDTDWIEYNIIDTNNIIEQLIKDNLYLQDELDIVKGTIELADKVTKKLYRENKKLKNTLSKYNADQEQKRNTVD